MRIEKSLVRIELPEAASDPHTLPWAVKQDPIFGQSVAFVGIVLALSVIGLPSGDFRERRTRENQPGFPVM